VGEAIEAAIRAYAEDVRTRSFPTPEHTYAMKSGPAKGMPAKSAKVRSPERASSGALSGSPSAAAKPRKSRKT
jgi:hypothetical protein